jgi:hypothetical protein
MTLRLIWDLDDKDNTRNKNRVKPIYDMKCNKCLKFIGAYTEPEKCKYNYCPHCGQPLKMEDE